MDDPVDEELKELLEEERGDRGHERTPPPAPAVEPERPEKRI